MSASLITASIWYRADRTLTADTVPAALAALTDTDREDLCEQASGGGFEDMFGGDVAEFDKYVTGLVATLLDAAQGNGEAMSENDPTGTWTHLVCGGESWGDDPNESFTALSNLQSLPTVLAAAGFHIPTSA